ncbi:IclR family transcriptional regulator [Ramlibacter sp.]|uniref:IclR family transcriptional regulator n=1 Tax=Ramlibacter sp. TaxID=1917967 RepID=UPI003D09C098
MSILSELDRPPSGDTADARTREVPAVRRAMAMLWLLGRHPEGLGLSRIARELDVLPSTCLHILRELVAARLVNLAPEAKLYRLGSGVLTLARQVTHQNRFVQLAQPVLNNLSREFHVGASAQERDGDGDMVVLAAASVLPGDMVSPGARTPLFTSASGRLLAAFNDFTEAELRARFAQARWQAAPDVDVWLKEVRAAKRNGYAVDEAHFRKGITAIAGPVFNADGRLERAISITTITAQLDNKMRKILTAAVLQAAAEITQGLR